MPFRLPSLSPVTWVTAEKITQQALWLVLFAILAPILGPRPYGVFSIVMVFVGFCEFVLGDGMAEVMVTIPEFEQPHAATVNLAGGMTALGLGLALAGLAPAIGAIFHDGDITRLMWALAPLPLLSLLSAAPIASLQRGMLFKRLALRTIASLAIGGAAGIALALAGAGVWALALQVVVQRFAEVVIAWLSVPLRFQFAWSGRHFRDLRPVGSNVLAARVMMFASGQVPRLILGYVLGPTQVGFFTLANRFLDVIIYTMVLPRVAVGRIELRTLRAGTAEFERRFARMLQDVALVAFPLLLGAATVMPDLYHLWLDQRWLGGVVPAQLILLSGVPLTIFYCADAAFLGARLSALFKWTATLQAVTTAVTVLCGAPFGLDPACAALAVRPWLLLPLYLSLLRRRCRLAGAAFLTAPLRSLAGAALMAAILRLPFWHLPWIDARLNFVALIAVGALCYGTFQYGFARGQLRAFLADLVLHRS
jgi:PST family polysaccharide transporter